MSFESQQGTVFDEGEYGQAGEPGEEEGRLKDDREVCDSYPDYPGHNWVDQDYGDIDNDGQQETCRTNTFYGSEGVRWFSADYVNKYENSVKQGIDDDWNQFLDESDEYEGKNTPVDTGGPEGSDDTVATKGFCGGDDGGEHLAVQRCFTDLCRSNDSVKGIVKSSDAGACMFERSNYENVNGEAREIVQPGEDVKFEFGGNTEKITCLGGIWFNEWPINAEEDSVEVEQGDEVLVPFSVVNPTDQEETYTLDIEGDQKQFSEFNSNSQDFREVTVPAQDAKVVNVAVNAVTLDQDGVLRVQAVAEYSDQSGYAETTVDVVEQSSEGEDEEGSQGPDEVPGIKRAQVLAAALVASGYLFIS